MNGFIKLHRRIQRNLLWDDGEPFCRFKAFVDLLFLAEWKPKKRIIKGCIIEAERGQVVASLRFLAGRWGWSKNKVSAYLKLLTEDGIVGQQTGQGISIITICNYERYQGVDSDEGTANGTQKGQTRDSDGTVTGHRRDKLEEGKEGQELDTHTSRTSEIPPCSLAEAVQAGAQMMVCTDAASKWWHERDSVGWVDGKGNPIIRWQSALKAYGDTWRNVEARNGSRGSGHQDKPKSFSERDSERTGRPKETIHMPRL